MLILANLFIFMSFQMLIPTLPPYFKSIGASGLEIGLVTTLFSVGAIFSRPFIGYFLEYKTRKPLVLFGVIALLLITLLYPISQMILLLLLLRLVHGLAWGWSTTANGTAGVDIVPNSRLGEGMGYFGLSVTLGMIIAPSLGIFLFQITTFTNLIYTSAILGFISIMLVFSVQFRTPEAVKNTRKEDIKFTYLGSMVEKSSWFPALITVIATFGYGAIMTFIVIFGEERGIQHIFLFYLGNAIVAALTRPIVGRWFDQKGPIGLVIVCSAFTFLGMWVLSFAHSDIHILSAGILFGLGFGSLMPTMQSWVLSLTPPNRRGVANGMYFSALDLGIGLSGIVFGFLADYVETGALFQIASVFLLIAMVMTFIEGRKNKLHRKQAAFVTEK
ncbi:MFS transporter [Bacillus dakarensis]|uniref:MFS transporter n=1 Tax=Robertmurraya dakarensis TaxID=1926278 RepID=UPI000980F5BB|nr:MFS transporter [Bacillus dakarensis]